MHSVCWRGTCVAALMVVAPTAYCDDKPAKSAPTATAAPHYTQSLRVNAPSVKVRSNPKPQNDNTKGAGQYAFIDESGELTSTPPADFEFPETGDARAADPVPRRSTVDPKAILIDTSHIRAVMRARVDETGKATIECLHSTDPAVQKVCTEPHTPESKPSGSPAKEDGQ